MYGKFFKCKYLSLMYSNLLVSKQQIWMTISNDKQQVCFSNYVRLYFGNITLLYTLIGLYTWSGTSNISFMFDIAYCRFTWRDCSTMLKLILCLPTGSVLCWVRYCWRPRSGMTRPCGMWTTVRSWRTLQWRTCKSGFIEHSCCQGVKMNIFFGGGGVK